MWLLIAYLIIINALGFFLMLADKRRARKKKWRIPEATLFIVAAVGGSLGILLGMYLFRHKTRHLRFTGGIPLILALQILLALIIATIVTTDTTEGFTSLPAIFFLPGL